MMQSLSLLVQCIYKNQSMNKTESERPSLLHDSIHYYTNLCKCQKHHCRRPYLTPYMIYLKKKKSNTTIKYQRAAQSISTEGYLGKKKFSDSSKDGSAKSKKVISDSGEDDDSSDGVGGDDDDEASILIVPFSG